MEAAIKSVEAEVRQRVREEVLEEMKEEAVVQYISGLESENLRLKQAARVAAVTQVSQAAALASLRRAEEKAAGHPIGTRGTRPSLRPLLRRRPR